jgi:outer membrane biosynthesis protein TonB
VERPSVRVVGTSHPAFGDAARAATASMRFRPAEVGGRPVRQLVELPFEFRLQ